MRLMSYLIVLCSCVSLHAAPQFPLQLPVAHPETAVFAGPAATHYATDHLSPGTVVDIYRLDPDNWCAIRPPAGSFCLVRAAAVARTADDSAAGEVLEEGTKCWVGTQLGEVADPLWQVKLRRGERVRILGEIPADPATEEDAGWLQIAPPNGEFRWIPLECFATTAQEQIVAAAQGITGEVRLASATSEPQESARRQSRTRPPRQFPDDAKAIPTIDAGELLESPGPDRSEPTLTAPSDGRAVRGVPPQRHLVGGNGAWQPARRPIAQVAGLAPAAPWNQTPTIVATPSGTSDGRTATSNLPALQPEIAADWPWPAELQRLDLQLSTMVLDDPSRWNLEGLQREVAAVRGGLASSSDLAIADHLLNKIRRFQEIRGAQLQSANLASSPLPPLNRGGQPAVMGMSGGQPVLEQRPLDVPVDLGTALQSGTSFDAYGWLNELVREGGKGQTSYVLQDDQGKITHLITPAPGVNLHRYVKSKVGLIGQKGFHNKFQLDHVTAERVVRLDTVTR